MSTGRAGIFEQRARRERRSPFGLAGSLHARRDRRVTFHVAHEHELVAAGERVGGTQASIASMNAIFAA